MTRHRKLSASLFLCCIFIVSASSVYAPQSRDNKMVSPDLASITSQYTNISSLSFNSGGEFEAWANLIAFSGDGSFETPYYFKRLNITGMLEPGLKLSNIRSTWFIFDDCIFQTHLWYNAVEIKNVTKGVFNNCVIYGAISHNNSDFNVIMRSYIFGDVYIDDSLHTGFYHNTFDVDAPVFVMSLFRTSTNVSFYDNNFLSNLELFGCTECNVVNNRFLGSVSDYGYANNWDGNSYSDYDGIGPYIIQGTAGSTDSNPAFLETSTITWPGTTTTSTSGLTTTTTTRSFTDNSSNDVLIGIIGIELIVVILLINVRKQSGQ
ncbi:MAG: hypothetical protein ACFFER_07265 [Candidatus Thorarchaeota archaeon]